MSGLGSHEAPEWLAALIRAPAGGVVTSVPVATTEAAGDALPTSDPPEPPPLSDQAPPPSPLPRIVIGTAVRIGDAVVVTDPQPGPDSEPAAPLPEPTAPEPEPVLATPAEETLRALPLDAIRPHPGQPRRSMDEAELQALADSIAEQGVIQPIVVRPLPGRPDAYEIVAGERRWRAARMAGLELIAAVVRPLDDAAMAEVALVENIQRADLPALDEALAYQQLIDAHGRTQDDIARRLGRNRSHIAHMLRLLRLPDEVQGLIRDASLSVGHARVLVNAADPAALARRIVAEGLTVRQTEEAAKATRSEGAAKRPPPAPLATPESAAWEERFGAALARPVAVKPAKRGGSLVIHYDSDDDLASILARISR